MRLALILLVGASILVSCTGAGQGTAQGAVGDVPPLVTASGCAIHCPKAGRAACKDQLDTLFGDAQVAGAADTPQAAIAAYESALVEAGLGSPPWFVLLAHYELAGLSSSIGKADAARGHYQAVIELYDVIVDKGGALPSCGADMAAEAAFALAEAADGEYVELPLSQSDLKDQLDAKVTALTQVTEAYVAASGYEIPYWSVAASCRIGRLYEHFIKALVALPPPPAPLDAEAAAAEKAMYEAFITDYSSKLGAKVLSTYETCTAEAVGGKLASPYVEEALSSLAKVAPDHPNIDAYWQMKAALVP